MILNDDDYQGFVGRIKKKLLIGLYLSMCFVGALASPFAALLNFRSVIDNLIIIDRIQIDQKQERVVAGTQKVRDKSRSLRLKVQLIEEPIYKIRQITTYRIEARINTAAMNNPQVSRFKKLVARIYVLFKNGRTETHIYERRE